jgi:hypothetical protein
MSRLVNFWKWLVGLFVHEAVEQVKEEIKKPSVMEDEKTPDEIKRNWNAYVADQLRVKDGGPRQQP